ncbi:MAG: hypothetical protein A3H06_02420 [Candidatus Colwellbacteria bacterium RIFCSPLOWO2_12_FULL_44_13]|uniref:Uncharacterized protein n=3 Tax=Candidatus Colwelliibacteriota TaxID=1817904 RepID=A0A1G1Z6I5_9BACT|nr:MAG: hypothetical protein A3F24_00120 [Candidatus Colwellbacteria bacterium RIFCSPHIGHO2_12_FULL_44_17]OGY60235.1 MAG: hypothetical protein A3I31_00640 [Candidatus Colwellbacteria bacterium RIFCSPLOWO2_02_FULL_44_20b]OGY62043.1 MAG: hypothetical protein A3H06_02420 [Candidatus Colwellbacteria bacterium RIFCSPLOWO2_12_FULL_44_13]
MFGSLSYRQLFILLLTLIYISFLGLFLFLYISGQRDTTLNLTSNSYGIMSLLGGLYGVFVVARHWGGFKSDVGKAVTFFSIGLIVWSVGFSIYLYYNLVLQVEVPYPSWADAGFFPAYALWAIGMVMLSKATGAKFGLRKLGGKALLLLVPVSIAAASYYLLIIVARGGVVDFEQDLIKIFLDIGYPLWDVIILTIAILIYGLSYRYFGGKYRLPIYIILGSFVINYFGDFSFSYTTTIGSYYNGSFADVMFATTMYLISVGIALLDPRSVSIYLSDAVKGNQYQLASRIIKEQVAIIGPVAWGEAQEVDGLSIDVSRGEVYITGNRKEVLDRLISRYERLFGRASLEVCREAIRPVVSQIPAEEIPERLR